MVRCQNESFARTGFARCCDRLQRGEQPGLLRVARNGTRDESWVLSGIRIESYDLQERRVQ
jgi:hypothetical protein